MTPRALTRRLAPTSAASVLAALAVAACGTSSSPAPVRTTVTAAATSSGIPRSLRAQQRPLGDAPAFHPPARGPVIGGCRPRLGRRNGVHVELFAADRVALVAAGIGTRAPRRWSHGRIARARCYGALVTLEPTGVVLVRPGARLTVGDLMRSWGRSLGRRRLLSFGGAPVTAYVGGRRWTEGPPSTIPLRRHAEIVIEIGPHVPPHHAYRFPPGS